MVAGSRGRFSSTLVPPWLPTSCAIRVKSTGTSRRSWALSHSLLAAQITLYAAEANVVHDRRLWPRSIVQPPLTEADIQVLTDIAKVGERRPEQRVEVRYDVDGRGGDVGIGTSSAAAEDAMHGRSP